MAGQILNHMVQCPESVGGDHRKGSAALDAGFAALSDPTRRGILERLGRNDATISELAAEFGMTLTGVKKHVGVLETARLVSTEKVGRTRTCRLGPRRLDEETAWIERYRRELEARLDSLGEFLARTEGTQP